ncbi:MAG TPA: AMP-binding protein [Acidimicrobiales bacterium]|nr:AMP-binding protein [Acidimicrobiales bacterium]
MGVHAWVLREPDVEDRRRFAAEGWWPDHSVGQRMADGLAGHRDLPFVIHSRTRPWNGTFGEVLDLARRAASGLVARGVRPGDVVTFQTPNWLEGAITFYAAAFVGAVVAPIVHIYGSRETSYILAECRPRVHVTAARYGHQDFLANLASTPEVPGMQLVVLDGPGPAGSVDFKELLTAEPIESPASVDPGTPALVGWTSGTTARPKGVVHSHHTVCAEIAQLGATSPPTERPSLIANPISHAIGMLGALLIPVDRGKPVHLVDQWEPGEVLDLISSENLSAGGGAPYFLTSLLDHPRCGAEHLERLHFQGMGGAPVPRAVMERATEIGLNIYSMYGSTEHPSITGCTHSDPLDKRLSTDGRPLPGCEIKLVDPAGREVERGEPGEILSRGPECFLGYTDASLTARVFDEDGWYHTGDIGVLDPEGYLSITDRISDVIIRGGENISAAEVEEVLMTLAGVAEVAVVAAPDARMGEHAAAFVRMGGGRPAPELPELRRHLEAAGVARQKWPEELLPVDDFPRTSSGKVQKYMLRARLRGGGD